MTGVNGTFSTNGLYRAIGVRDILCMAGGKDKHRIEGLRERSEHLDIFIFFSPSLNGVLFPMFCLVVEGECL